METIERTIDIFSYFPRNVGYAKDKKPVFDRLLNTSNKQSPFSGRDMASVFLYSAALGFRENKKLPLKNRQPNIPTSVFTADEKALMIALAVWDAKNVDILFDVNQVVKIIEEYANGGINLLEEVVKSGGLGDPDKRLESNLRSLLKVKEAEKETKERQPVIPADESMELIYELENNLRVLVKTKLSTLSKNWLEERIPSGIAPIMIERWKTNKARTSKGHDLFLTGSDDLLDYSELGDLYEIIKWTKNWNEVFEAVFKNKKVFEADMEQVLMIRPDKAHSRQLNEIQKSKLKAICQHMNALINAALERE